MFPVLGVVDVAANVCIAILHRDTRSFFGHGCAGLLVILELNQHQFRWGVVYMCTPTSWKGILIQRHSRMNLLEALHTSASATWNIPNIWPRRKARPRRKLVPCFPLKSLKQISQKFDHCQKANLRFSPFRPENAPNPTRATRAERAPHPDVDALTAHVSREKKLCLATLLRGAMHMRKLWAPVCMCVCVCVRGCVCVCVKMHVKNNMLISFQCSFFVKMHG